MLYVIGIGIAFFLSFLLWTKKGSSQADRILAAWMSLIGLHLSFYYLIMIEGAARIPYLLGLETPFPLIHAPMLYLYARAQTQGGRAFSRRALAHFLPIALAYAWITPFIASPAAYKIYVYEHQGIGYENLRRFLFGWYVVSSVAYAAFSLYLLRAHRQNIAARFSSMEKINLAWLQYLIYGLSLIAALAVWGNDTHVFSGVVGFVLFTGYFGINQAGIFNAGPLAHAAAAPTNPALVLKENEADKKKYAKSGLSEAAAAGLYERLAEAMAKERWFEEPELTLVDLAARLSVHSNYLSQTINEKAGMNFYDYINMQRVEAFKALLQNPKNRQYTLLALAYQCGFNSKSAFNRQFKKATGLAPSEYYRMALEGSDMPGLVFCAVSRLG